MLDQLATRRQLAADLVKAQKLIHFYLLTSIDRSLDRKHCASTIVFQYFSLVQRCRSFKSVHYFNSSLQLVIAILMSGNGPALEVIYE